MEIFFLQIWTILYTVVGVLSAVEANHYVTANSILQRSAAKDDSNMHIPMICLSLLSFAAIPIHAYDHYISVQAVQK